MPSFEQQLTDLAASGKTRTQARLALGLSVRQMRRVCDAAPSLPWSRRQRVFNVAGRRGSLSELSRTFGISKQAVAVRLGHGWTPSAAFLTPIGEKPKPLAPRVVPVALYELVADEPWETLVATVKGYRARYL